MKETSIAYKCKGKERYPSQMAHPPKRKLVHLYKSGNHTVCGVKLTEEFVIVHYYVGKVSCKDCLKGTK